MFEQKYYCLVMCFIIGADTLTVPEISSDDDYLKISSDQTEILDNFRNLVSDENLHDYQKADGYLLRWVKAKNWDINAAVEMFKESQRWRKSNNIDSILNETILDLPCHYTLNTIDRQGRTVMILNLLNVRSLILQGKGIRKILRYYIQVLEREELRKRELGNSTGTYKPQSIHITDFSGYSWKEHACPSCLQLLTNLLKTIELYYPQTIGYDIWINVPRSTGPLVDTAKKILSDSGTGLDKFLIFGVDKTEWAPFLLKLIPEDQLRVIYGGTKM